MLVKLKQAQLLETMIEEQNVLKGDLLVNLYDKDSKIASLGRSF